jgi:uncharacterized protein (DUF924 family)
VVYSTFDKIAQAITLPLMDDLFFKPRTDTDAAFRHEAVVIMSNMCYGMWPFLPLMHSEDLSLHDKADEGYNYMEKYFTSLKPDTTDDLGRTFTAEEIDAAVKHVQFARSFEQRHRVIIEQFGRYPYRNEVLGRESTKEEVDYLEGGGERFSA